MKTLPRLVLLAVLVALGFWAWNFFFPSPQKVIAKNLGLLARSASFSAADGNFKKIADAERIGSLMSARVHVVLELTGNRSQTFDSREELVQAALAARGAVKGLSATFTDTAITVNPDRKSATAFTTVEARVAGESDPIVTPLKFTFAKTNGDWLITQIASVKSLQQ